MNLGVTSNGLIILMNKRKGRKNVGTGKLSLRHNFIWTLIGNLIYAGSQWGMVMILAKIGTPEMVGQFALGLAIAAPVIMFTNLQLRAVQATDSKGDYHFTHYLGLRLIGTSLALAVITGVTLVSGYRWETALVILAVGLAKAFESISDVIFGLLQQHERMDRIAISMMIKGPLSLLALGAAIWLTNSIFFGSLGLAVAWAAILASYDIRSAAMILGSSSLASKPSKHCRAWPKPNWDFRMLGRLAWVSLPLGLSMMLISLNSSIPRYFIEHYLGERELGIFAAMAYLMVTGGMVVSALGQSASPRLAKYFAAGHFAAFRALLLKLVGLSFFLGLLGIVVVVSAGREILTILYRPEYAGRLDVLFWLMVAAGIGYVSSFLGTALTATRAFHLFVIPYGIITAVALASSALLVPMKGLLGASWALCVISLAGCVIPIILLMTIERGKREPVTRYTS
jgi:O-antigen/teichoic acid export membrane protein